MDTVEIYCIGTPFWISLSQRLLKFFHTIVIKPAYPLCIFLSGSCNDFLEKISSLCDARQNADWRGNKCLIETSYLIKIVTVTVIHYIPVNKNFVHISSVGSGVCHKLMWTTVSAVSLRSCVYLWFSDAQHLSGWGFVCDREPELLASREVLGVCSYFFLF